MILIVGDKPSKKNKDKNVPFVGTISYKTLLEWLYKMNIDISRVQLGNASDISINKYNEAYTHFGLFQYKYVIALGEVASKFLTSKEIDHFKLPHPSGLNRQNNNKKLLESKLKECEEWLNSES